MTDKVIWYKSKTYYLRMIKAIELTGFSLEDGIEGTIQEYDYDEYKIDYNFCRYNGHVFSTRYLYSAFDKVNPNKVSLNYINIFDVDVEWCMELLGVTSIKDMLKVKDNLEFKYVLIENKKDKIK